MSELAHECGIAAIYHLPGEAHALCPEGGPDEISRLLPRMLLDIQNRLQYLLPVNIELHSLKLSETENSFAEWYASDNMQEDVFTEIMAKAMLV